jgi:hypothetical protein
MATTPGRVYVDSSQGNHAAHLRKSGVSRRDFLQLCSKVIAVAHKPKRRFRRIWQRDYGPMVRRLERDLPELLSFFHFPRHLWKKLRTTNVIERCFVEVRRRTRPMVCL